MSLRNTGIFEKTQDAKTKTAEAEANQKARLDEYETELNKNMEQVQMEEIAEIQG